MPPSPEVPRPRFAPGPLFEHRDLLLLGLITGAALLLRLTLAEQFTGGLAVAAGPDADDWAAVFRGARQWPPGWDTEWEYRYPLLPVLAAGLAHAARLPVAFCAQMLCVIGGALLVPIVFIAGRQCWSAPAGLLAAGFVLVCEPLLAHSLLPTAYGLVPSLYALLVLGLLWSVQPGGRGPAVIGTAAALLALSLLQGTLMVLVTVAAALLAWVWLRWRRPEVSRPGLWRLILPSALGLLTARAALWHFGVIHETPVLGALAHVRQDLISARLGVDPAGGPSGYRPGPAGADPLLQALREALSLPALPALLLAAAGLFLLLRRLRRSPNWAPLLLLVLLPGPAYGLLSHTEPFHWFQWLPLLGLLLAIGLCGWPRSPWLAWTLACLGLLHQWAWVPWRHPPSEWPRYERVIEPYLRGAQGMGRVMSALAGPVSHHGTLLLADPWLWAQRGRLPDRLRAMDPRRLGSDPLLLSPLPRPWLLVTAQPDELASWHFEPRVERLPVTRFPRPGSEHESWTLFLLQPEGVGERDRDG